MSEEYSVQIKVDPGSSIPTVKEFGEAAQTTERKTRGMEHAAHGASEALQELSGSASGLVKALASGAAIGVAVEGFHLISETIEGISESAHELHLRLRELHDRYIELTNAAQKFTPAGQAVADVLDEQQALATRLHAALGSTTEIFDNVQDSVDGLNLAHAETISLTENLGKALQLSNKPLEQAGGLVERLAYAMASGSISTEELKRTMKEVPELAKLWTAEFGVSRTQLIKLVSDGKVSVQQLVDGLVRGSDEMNKAFGKQQQTFDQWKGSLKVAFETAKAKGAEYNDALRTALDQTANASISMKDRTSAAMEVVSDVFGKSFAKVNASQIAFITNQHDAAAAVERNAVANIKFSNTFDTFIHQWERMQSLHAQQTVDGITASVEGLRSVLADTVPLLVDVLTTGKLQTDPWAPPVNLYGTEEQWQKRKEAAEQAKKDREEHKRDLEEMQRQQLAVDLAPSWAEKSIQSNVDKMADTWKDFARQTREEVQKEFDAAEKYRTDQLTKHWHDSLDQIQRDAETKAKLFAQAFQPVEDAFDHLFATGKFDLASFGSAMESMLRQLAFQMLALGISGGSDSSLGSAIGHAIFGGGHATGGSYTVPGSGGPDSQRVVFDLTPGEHVQFTPPGSSYAGGRPTSVTVVQDRHGALNQMDSHEGERLVVNLARRNSRAIRSLTNRTGR
jgi:tape measure domain-containing protein